jgi:low temperature requirement protein LtrA
MTTAAPPRLRRAVQRDDERVRPLELFFDLVFVLTLTQCTELMSEHPTWQGLVEGVLIAGIMWWGWVGYSWVGSVVDPEEGLVRLGFFAAMAGLLIVALCIPEAYGDEGLLFAVGYGIVRFAQLYLLSLGGRDDPAFLRSVRGLAVGTTIGVALLIGGSFADGWLQIGIWAVALALDMGEPFLFGSEGWRLSPGHFAERHGLMIIVALGESIVAIGVGARALDIDAGIVAAALLALAISAALWWLYFDVVALVADRRLHNATPGREQNEIARDSFSYLHFPMIAGIELMALGFEKTLEHVGEHLALIPAVALMGGGAVYLLAHVAFRWRNVHRFSTQRLVAALVLLALIPVAEHVPALVSLGIVFVVLVAVLVYEHIRFAELRTRLRHAG